MRSKLLKTVNKEVLSLKKNKSVLYILFAVTVAVLLGLLSISQVYPVAIFVLTSLLIRTQTNNMVVILLLSLSVTFLYISYRCVKEGFDGKDGEENNDETESYKNKPKEKNDNREQMRMLKPKNLDDNDDETPYVDTASTLEDAYKNFEDILGSDGLSKLSEETQKLAKQQTNLVQAMNQMGPMVKQMQGVMKDVNGNGDIKSTLGQMQNMMSSLSK
jgi:hypothetical protein